MFKSYILLIICLFYHFLKEVEKNILLLTVDFSISAFNFFLFLPYVFRGYVSMQRNSELLYLPVELIFYTYEIYFISSSNSCFKVLFSNLSMYTYTNFLSVTLCMLEYGLQ